MDKFRNIGSAIRMIREARGLGQAQFARLSRVGKSQLSKYENGRELPKLETLGKILDTLELTPRCFFTIVANLDNALEEPKLENRWELSVSAEASTALESIARSFGELAKAVRGGG